MFEGLAIGLQQDQQGLVNLFIAVIAHKSVMAFSLGLTLAQARLKFKQYAISVIIFTMASPIGMLIGMGMSEMEQSLGGDIANWYVWNIWKLSDNTKNNVFENINLQFSVLVYCKGLLEEHFYT